MEVVLVGGKCDGERRDADYNFAFTRGYLRVAVLQPIFPVFPAPMDEVTVDTEEYEPLSLYVEDIHIERVLKLRGMSDFDAIMKLINGYNPKK